MSELFNFKRLTVKCYKWVLFTIRPHCNHWWHFSKGTYMREITWRNPRLSCNFQLKMYTYIVTIWFMKTRCFFANTARFFSHDPIWVPNDKISSQDTIPFASRMKVFPPKTRSLCVPNDNISSQDTIPFVSRMPVFHPKTRSHFDQDTIPVVYQMCLWLVEVSYLI